MIRAIAGDIIGSVYEVRGIKRKGIALFTSVSAFTTTGYACPEICTPLELLAEEPDDV